MPGGFNVNEPQDKYEDHWAVAVLPGDTLVPLPCPELPEAVLDSITSIQAHDSAALQAQAETWEEVRAVSKYANDLVQLPCERKIPMDPKQVSEAFAEGCCCCRACQRHVYCTCIICFAHNFVLA